MIEPLPDLILVVTIGILCGSIIAIIGYGLNSFLPKSNTEKKNKYVNKEQFMQHWILGPFESFSDFSRYMNTHLVTVNNIVIIKNESFIKAYQLKNPNSHSLEEIIVDWDEINKKLEIQRIMSNRL